jgi:hypothetical protein
MHPEALRVLKHIQEAFPAEAPPNLPLVREGTYRDDEVLAVEEDFADKERWPELTADFLDNAAGGWASALSFPSDEAASFFLPAYLAADLRGELARVDPVFYLTDGLDGSYRSTNAKPGRNTREDEARKRWRLFTPDQCAAVAAYLSVRKRGDVMLEEIEASLHSFWTHRAERRGDP